MQKKLSVLLITFNEEQNIRGFLKNMAFADEIIVVDSQSTDRTVEIIKKEFRDVKLIQREFKNFSDQRNFALQKAKYNWIFFPDADERVSDDLKEEILSKIKEPGVFVAFCMRRNFYFQKKKINYSGYQTHKVCRLFRKDRCSFDEEKKVHETLIINGVSGFLNFRLDHFSFITYESYKKKLRQYAGLRAEELYEAGIKPNFYHFYLKPLYRFFNQYVMRLGFFDGKEGFQLSQLNAYEVKQRYIELDKLLSGQKK